MFVNPFLRRVEWLYNYFIKIGSNLQSIFLIYMRITWGHQFVLTGWGKLHAIEKTAEFFASLHISHPLFNAYFVSSIETVCGFCLLVGFASRIITIPLIIVMLAALSTAHAPSISNFRFLFQPESLVQQTPYPFLITCILVFCFGPGRVSIDAWLKRWSQEKAKY